MRLRACLGIASVVVMFGGTASAVADDRSGGCDWTQWGRNAAHNGQSCARGQSDLRLLDRVVVDPFAEQENADGGGILVHFPVPLVDSDGNVFALRKGGSYVACDPPGSGEPAPCGQDPANLNRMTWSLQALRRQHDQLIPKWTFTSDWKPTQLGFESLVQSAMNGDYVYVPGAGGTVFQLAKSTGRMVRRINPFGHNTVDPQAFVAGGLTFDEHGTLFYNVIKTEQAGGSSDAHSWLVRVTRDRTSLVDYRTLIPGAPRATDQCYMTFQNVDVARPYPPAPQPDGSPTLPPQLPCGSQRAGINVVPAVGPDGTIVTVTRANGGSLDNYGYVVALNPDLTLKWAASLRGRLNDGCGVLTPYGNGFFDCRPGTATGIDPYTNMPPAAGVSDGSTASPVILPDGGVVYGTRNLYNGFRGHLMKFDRGGRYVGNYDFGWDITPAVSRHDGGYSMLIKDNHYLSGGPFTVTSLDSALAKEWTYTNTETRTCQRAPDGTVTCVDDGEHPNGFEWCVSAPAIDRDGNVYGLSEDGNLYVIDKQGHEREKVFLSKTVASAYTPVSLDSRGRVYAQNNGELYVLGH
jgi:outer membrane protein assembly factor BamB